MIRKRSKKTLNKTILSELKETYFFQNIFIADLNYLMNGHNNRLIIDLIISTSLKFMKLHGLFLQNKKIYFLNGFIKYLILLLQIMKAQLFNTSSILVLLSQVRLVNQNIFLQTVFHKHLVTSFHWFTIIIWHYYSIFKQIIY